MARSKKTPEEIEQAEKVVNEAATRLAEILVASIDERHRSENEQKK